MKAVFVELPPFERVRKDYWDDNTFRNFQNEMLNNPFSGDVIKGTGGLRKVRFRDEKRRKGKRGGVRVIYYWWKEGAQFWLFTIYGKDEVTDLTNAERKLLAELLRHEIQVRSL
ncbi:type II toxin-antitoxin system RelE/ParE family toxin [Alkalimarinus sediminis]|uniref:Type II toxin-antitoxin system RelE/ParE family toxin n=1 Tax=Alkalimarinus sediminis TaxID=1632866 RepID=A0A9E8HJF4_9ALTE|nr:type II toxin-antitoxin system RelE/ParE family toxin [Alkalimarinus sediminis]UZW75780.1 type II toxin-antitoxin system RelE/ParE family toxin [Alkalimarinus sediminis]